MSEESICIQNLERLITILPMIEAQRNDIAYAIKIIHRLSEGHERALQLIKDLPNKVP